MTNFFVAIGIVVSMFGAVATLFGLVLLIEWCVWHTRERMGKYKMLHAYIKDHKKEFWEWGKKYNARNKQGGGK